MNALVATIKANSNGKIHRCPAKANESPAVRATLPLAFWLLPQPIKPLYALSVVVARLIDPPSIQVRKRFHKALEPAPS
jgi:hypothetical protein